jgi:FKBP-type peptidyl-prolyl cis-trans isomerase
MTKASFLVIFLFNLLTAVAQSNPDSAFIKLADGTEYIVYPSIRGVNINTGNYFEMNVMAKYKDSILYSTMDEGMPEYGLYDTAAFPFPYKIIFSHIKTGDIIVVRIPTDSLLAQNQAPPFIAKGEYIYQTYYPNNFFKTKEEVDSVQKVYLPVARERALKKQLGMVQKSITANKVQIEKDSKLIEAYLTKNKIKFSKADWGTYLVIKKEGIGNKLTYTDTATVNYTGKMFGTNKVFDSNTDPKFKHAEPYEVYLNQISNVIPGWTDALLQMKNGTAASIYIPSSLAFGTEGRMPDISPNAILIFDMKVIKVNNKAVPETVRAPKLKAAVKAKPVKSVTATKAKTSNKK